MNGETGAAEFSMLANYQGTQSVFLSGTRAVIDALAFATDTILGQYLKGKTSMQTVIKIKFHSRGLNL